MRLRGATPTRLHLYLRTLPCIHLKTHIRARIRARIKAHIRAHYRTHLFKGRVPASKIHVELPAPRLPKSRRATEDTPRVSEGRQDAVPRKHISMSAS